MPIRLFEEHGFQNYDNVAQASINIESKNKISNKIRLLYIQILQCLEFDNQSPINVIIKSFVRYFDVTLNIKMQGNIHHVI